MKIVSAHFSKENWHKFKVNPRKTGLFSILTKKAKGVRSPVSFRFGLGQEGGANKGSRHNAVKHGVTGNGDVGRNAAIDMLGFAVLHDGATG